MYRFTIKRKNKKGKNYTLFGGGTNFAGLCHIFIMKYMLFETMNNLNQINNNFLNNKDCMKLIGEYVGLKKEWMINVDRYRDQAFEVARLLHCVEHYDRDILCSYDETNWDKCFDRIGSFTKEYFPGKTSAIDDAIKIGKQWIIGINQGLKQDKVMTEARWGEMKVMRQIVNYFTHFRFGLC